MREFFRIYWPLIAIAVLGVIVALMFVAPAPPKRVTIAGGAEGGAYAATAALYAESLKAKSVTPTVITTAGSVDNLRRLASGEASIAIVQTGTAGEADVSGLKSLGSIFYEPLWVFYRSGSRITDLRDVAGKRVAVGAPGSGLRALTDLLLPEAGVEPGEYTPVELGGQAAARALLAGEADVALIVSGADPVWLTELVAAPGIELLSQERARALKRRHAFLDEVTLYAGVLDPARNLPAQDVTLVAPAAEIVVREDLHPAIQSVLIEAAYKHHARGTILSDPGVFPTPTLTDIELSDEADRYYRNGPTVLRRWFPFDIANFMERAWVLVIPLVTLMFPLMKAAPPVYRWRIRRKIYVWYQKLRELEMAGRDATTPEERAGVREQLADLQGETGRVKVPLPYNDDLYRLRAHISFVAELVDSLSAKDRAGSGKGAKA